MSQEKRLYEPLPYVFQDAEIRALGQSLAQESQNLFELRESKANAMASANALIKASLKRIAELTEKITTGRELREVEVIWMNDNPRPGTKAMIRVDDPDVVLRYEPMTPAEMQGTFGFSVGEGREEGDQQ